MAKQKKSMEAPRDYWTLSASQTVYGGPSRLPMTVKFSEYKSMFNQREYVMYWNPRSGEFMMGGDEYEDTYSDKVLWVFEQYRLNMKTAAVDYLAQVPVVAQREGEEMLNKLQKALDSLKGKGHYQGYVLNEMKKFVDDKFDLHCELVNDPSWTLDYTVVDAEDKKEENHE